MPPPIRLLKAARGRITGRFGDTGVATAHVPKHLGTDIGHGNKTPADLEVWAPGPGEVIAAGPQGTYGIRVEIDLGDGYTVLLAHLDELFVAVGAIVSVGQVIARMGNTGTRDVHLHQELRYRGVPLDAEPHFATLASLTTTALPDQEEDETMPYGYFVKCPELSNTFWVSQVTGKKRPATLGELQAAQAFNTATGGVYGTGYIVPLSRAALDTIPDA